MNLDFIYNKKEYTEKAILAVVVAMSLIIAIKTISNVLGLIKTPWLIKSAVKENVSNDEKVKEFMAQRSELADELKKRSMFAPPAPKPKAPKVTGILGSQALINGKWYKVGDTAAGAKVVAIEPTEVTIEWEGKEMKLAPIAAATTYNSNAAPKPKPQQHEAKNISKTASKGQEPKASSQEEIPAWILALPERFRARVLERWRNATPEEREEMRQRMQNRRSGRRGRRNR